RTTPLRGDRDGRTLPFVEQVRRRGAPSPSSFPQPGNASSASPPSFLEHAPRHGGRSMEAAMRTAPHSPLALPVFTLSLMLAAGTSAWAAWPPNPSDAVAVCTSSGTQDAQVIVSDGAGGAIIEWEDQRSGIFDIYALR